MQDSEGKNITIPSTDLVLFGPLAAFNTCRVRIDSVCFRHYDNSYLQAPPICGSLVLSISELVSIEDEDEADSASKKARFTSSAQRLASMLGSRHRGGFQHIALYPCADTRST